MAVNGIEIKVGQEWSTKDDKQFEVVEYRPGVAHCWHMCSVKMGMGTGLNRNYTDDGTIELVGTTNDCSLDKLLSDVPASKNGVNGVEIKVGQEWSTKDGLRFEVVKHEPSWVNCWIMRQVGTMSGICRNYTDDGTIELVGSTNDCSLDELLSDAPAPKNGVNGVEIKVGQVWLTKDGARVVAIRRFDNGGNYDTLAYPWEMQDADNPHLLRMYNDEGACKPHRINRNRDRDLDKLIPGAVTQVRVPGDTEKLRDKIDAPAPKNGVNGVEIKLGQWWRTADDLEMVVAFKARSATPMQPFVWRLDSLNPAKSTECRWYSDSGETSAGYQRRLTQLIGSADSLAPGPIVDSEQLGLVSRDQLVDAAGSATVANVKKPSALDVQVAGKHYKEFAIQPVEFIHANGIGYFEGNVIKYVARWRKKGGVKDLEKAKHYIDLLIELEAKNGKVEP